MEAGDKGACEAGGVSVGLGIELPFECGAQPVGRQGHQLPLLLRAQDDVRQVRPGLRRAARRARHASTSSFEALTLVQTQKVTSFPIVLMGTSYWKGLFDWLRDTVLAEGKINAKDLDMMVVTDDVDEAVALMVAAREDRWPTRAPKRPDERGGA